MRGLRSKILMLLIVYFAGFATAIYTLSPDTVQADTGSRSRHHSRQSARVESSFDSDTAEKLNASIHKGLSFAKEKALELGDLIKTKLEEHRDKNR